MKWIRKEGDDPSRGSRTHASFLQESFTMKTRDTEWAACLNLKTMLNTSQKYQKTCQEVSR